MRLQKPKKTMTDRELSFLNEHFDGDELEAMKVGKSPERVVARNLKNDKGEIIEATNHPMMKFTFESEIILEQGDVLRKERPENQRVII